MFNSFQPEQPDTMDVPYFDDVIASDGWEGHESEKSLDALTAEITTNMSRLGCIVMGVMPGKYGDRFGFQIRFAMRSEGGAMIPSRLDIACLPLRERERHYSSDTRILKTKRMGLYMINKAIKGMWFMQALVPDFVPFMSQMLNRGGETLGSTWIQSGKLAALMPPKDDEFEEIIDAE